MVPDSMKSTATLAEEETQALKARLPKIEASIQDLEEKIAASRPPLFSGLACFGDASCFAIDTCTGEPTKKEEEAAAGAAVVTRAEVTTQ